jgi:lysophospholipase L1-like esterase
MNFSKAVPISTNEHSHLSGHSVSLPARDIQTPNGQISLQASTLWVEAPPFQAMTEDVVLSGRHQCAATYIRDVIVEPVSRSTVLELKKHFQVWGDCGQILARPEARGTQVTVEFIACHHRYDSVCFDLDSGLLVRLPGAPRLIDPEEYRPRIPEGLIHLYNLYVWPGGVDVIDVSDWQQLVRRGREDERARLRSYCQSALAPVLHAVMQRKSIRIGGYGDSITAMGGRPADLHLAPNGPSRDRIAWFSRYPAETRARIRQRTDGRHVRAGWCWALAEAFEQRGLTAEYRNWGVPGTTAGSDVKSDAGVPFYDGNHPDRLRPMLADECDLVVVGFGTNDLGDPNVYSNIRRLVEQIHETGARCIVVGSPGPNPVVAVRPYGMWLQTNADICRAARDTNAAYVPMEELYALGNEGALGLSRRTYAAANLINHPGISELQGIGEFLVGLTL